MARTARSFMLAGLASQHLAAALAFLVAFGACADVGLTDPADSDTGSPPAAGASGPGGATGNAPTPMPTTSPIAGASFWVDPYSNARRTVDAWRTARPADAAMLEKIAATPQARWIGNWNADVENDVRHAVATMSAGGAVPLLVAYNIPQRDCGGLSGGNNTSIAAYRSWIAAFGNGIGGRRAVVILEPDALAGMDCLSAADQQLRLELIRFAHQTLTAKGAIVYLDAGHARWHAPATMAARLTAAGVAQAQGFSLNVSNFVSTADNIAYGSELSGMIGGKHFVIDTGRNGLGPTPDLQWCNPAGRALGNRPTTATGHALVDAFLWIKTPGESDGACNGAPAAGVWMPEYALGLAQRAGW